MGISGWSADVCSADLLAQAGGGLGGGAGADGVGDALTDAGIDARPVGEGALEHLAVDAAQEAAAHLLDEAVAPPVVHDVAPERARLGAVTVVGVQLVSAATHPAVHGPRVPWGTETRRVGEEYGITCRFMGCQYQ